MYKFDIDSFVKNIINKTDLTQLEYSEKEKVLSFQTINGDADDYEEYATLDANGCLDMMYGGTYVSEIVERYIEYSDKEVDESDITDEFLLYLILQEIQMNLEELTNFIHDVSTTTGEDLAWLQKRVGRR